MAVEDTKSNQRTKARERRMLTVDITPRGRPTARATIRDISEEGMGGRCDCRLVRGETVTVLLPNGMKKEADVAWAKAEFFGLHFHSPLDADDLKRVQKVTAPYVVPTLFRPSTSMKRPGFSHYLDEKK